MNADAPTIAEFPPARDEPLLAGAIEQLDQAVMFELQALGEVADGGSHARRQSFERYQELIMLRL